MQYDWKEAWIDWMGLIVALSGEDRFTHLNLFKINMQKELSLEEHKELKKAIKKRFSPSNGENGCKSAVEAVKTITYD